jgi:cobalamin biosynthesis protein CobT
VEEPSNCYGLTAAKQIFFTASKDGKFTVADRVAEAANELRKLNIDLTGATEDDWPELIEAAIEEGTYFYFHTWKGKANKQYPNPRVNTDFDGHAKDYQGVDGVEAATVDESGDEEVTGDGGEEESSEESTEVDFMEMAKRADSKKKPDEDAQAELTTAAEAASLDPDDYETWTDLAEALTEAAGGGDDSGDDGNETEAGEEEEGEEESEESEESDESEEEEVEEEEITPKAGDVFKYKPKGQKKSVECEVVKGGIDSKKKTVKLKSLDDNKVYSGVPWGSLTAPE